MIQDPLDIDDLKKAALESTDAASGENTDVVRACKKITYPTAEGETDAAQLLPKVSDPVEPADNELAPTDPASNLSCPIKIDDTIESVMDKPEKETDGRRILRQCSEKIENRALKKL